MSLLSKPLVTQELLEDYKYQSEEIHQQIASLQEHQPVLHKLDKELKRISRFYARHNIFKTAKVDRTRINAIPKKERDFFLELQQRCETTKKHVNNMIICEGLVLHFINRP